MYTSVFALSGLASLLVGFIFRLVLPGQKYYAWAILGLGVALLAISVILDFRRMRGALASRRGKFGVGTTVKISLFAGIIVLVNAISIGTYHRFDFTGLAQFTLTSQTKEVLADLQEPVEVISFFTPAISPAVSTYARDLLAEYQNYTDQLTVSVVDPELKPDLARQYGVNRYGQYYSQLQGVTVFRSDQGQRDIYGLQIAQEAEHAFTSGGVPENASALIIAGPQEDLGTKELEILKSYLEQGGRLLLMLNPDAPDRFVELINGWWITFEDGTIIDTESYVAPDQDTPLVPRTNNSLGLVETYFPGAAAVVPKEETPDGVELVPMAWTSRKSWVEKGSLVSDRPEFDEGTDMKGPLAVGVQVRATESELFEVPTETRLVVMGDSDFAANEHFKNGNNSDLFLNAVNWLTAGEELISVDRKVLPSRRLILDPEQERFFHISSIGLLPLLLILAAGYVWWRRR